MDSNIFSLKMVLDNFNKVISLIGQVDKKYTYISIISTAILSFFPALSLRIMQHIMNMIQTQITDINVLGLLIVVYVLLGVFELLISSYLNYYKAKFLLKFNIHIKQMVLDKASKLTLKDYESSETYDMLQRADSHTDGDLIEFFDTVISIFGTIITVGSYLLIVSTFKKWLIPILIILPLIKYVITNRINQYEFNIIQSRTNKERQAWYNGYIITCGLNFKELKIYRLFEYFINKKFTLLKNFAKQDILIAHKRLTIIAIFGFLEQALIGCIFGYTVYSGYMGSILIGDIITYTRAIVSSKEQIEVGMQTFNQLNRYCLFFKQLFSFLELDEEKTTYKYNIKSIDRIEIKNLYFKYNSNDDYVLKNINLEINVNDFVAIVGRNGSGKTTLLKILLGFYDDYEGEILINGKELREISKIDFYNLIGVLFQDYTKYEASIRENIIFSCINRSCTDEEIMRTCDSLSFREFLESQEGGLDTQLGYWFENGKEISIGQWQKVALCRALIRNADVYFLDEPNASLDMISEKEIMESYRKVVNGKIGLLIVHKLSSVLKDINKIVLLNEGTIECCGTHEELERSSDLYREIFGMNK